MRKGPKIIQINGYRGIFLAGFIVICLIAGFVLFPAKVAAFLWNYVAANYIGLPKISLWQGGLLWAMTVISIYLINNKSFSISFAQPKELSDAEMRILMERIQMQKQAQRLNAMIMKSNDIHIINKDIPQQNIKTDSTEQSANINDEKPQQ